MSSNFLKLTKTKYAGHLPLGDFHAAVERRRYHGLQNAEFAADADVDEHEEEEERPEVGRGEAEHCLGERDERQSGSLHVLGVGRNKIRRRYIKVASATLKEPETET